MFSRKKKPERFLPGNRATWKKLLPTEWQTHAKRHKAQLGEGPFTLWKVRDAPAGSPHPQIVEIDGIALSGAWFKKIPA